MYLSTLFLPITATMLLPMNAIANPIALVVGEFEEHFSNEVSVSGNVIAGLMLTSLAPPQPKDFSPLIWVPSNFNEEQFVCLSVVSQDGVYSSRNTYKLPSSETSTLISADYSKSKYKALLTESSRTFALKAKQGNCLQNGNNTYFLTSSSRSTAKEQLQLFVDSLGATDVVVAARGGDRKISKGHCRALSGERKTGFDYSCLIPLPPEANGEFTVKVQRLKFGRKMPSITIKVIL